MKSENSELRFPEALAREISREHAAVRPLLPPGRRTLIVALLAAITGALFLLLAGLRSDFVAMPGGAVISLLFLRLFAGTSLIFLAMKEAVPAAGASARMRSFTFFSVATGLFLLPEIFARAIRFTGRAELEPFSCFALVVLVSLPSFVLIWLLLARSYPVRPLTTGALAGLGSGVVAEAVIFLACNNASVFHGVVVHGPAAVSLSAFGLLAGWIVARSRTRVSF